MITNCPECNLPISDKAFICPHCGYPLKKNIERKYQRSNKKKRLPNGFGQITELKGRNLRKPFRVMITVGKDEYGKPICKLLKPEAFYSTYNDAYNALVKYHTNPYDLDSVITVEQLYEHWSQYYFKNLANSSIYTISNAWRYCQPLYSMLAMELRPRHLKECINNAYRIIDGEKHCATPEIKKRIKALLNNMLDYAVEYEIVEKNYARDFTISKELIEETEKNKKSHICFTDQEMEILWQNINAPYVKTILCQCYSGWRPQELCKITLDSVDLEHMEWTGGMKTAAGINRKVPIHSKIQQFVREKYQFAVDHNQKYLFLAENRCAPFTYSMYFIDFSDTIKYLGIDSNHRPHDCRVQFVTMAKKYGVDEYAIKYLVGHTINDITEKIYTKRNINWLHDEIEKIK